VARRARRASIRPNPVSAEKGSVSVASEMHAAPAVAHIVELERLSRVPLPLTEGGFG